MKHRTNSENKGERELYAGPNFFTKLVPSFAKTNRKSQKKHKNLKNSKEVFYFFEIFDFFCKEILLDLFSNYYFRNT